MSYDATFWAKRVRVGNAKAKAILLVLADRADEEHSCFPGQKLIAFETEIPLRTVQRQLDYLEHDVKLIRREHRGRAAGGRTSDRYYLNVGGLPATVAGGVTRHSDGGLHATQMAEESPEESPSTGGDAGDVETDEEAAADMARIAAARDCAVALQLPFIPSDYPRVLKVMRDIPLGLLDAVVLRVTSVAPPPTMLDPAGLLVWRITHAAHRVVTERQVS